MAFWNRSQLRAGALHWLLELTWAGRTWRFAESHLTANADGDGDKDWLEGLDAGPDVLDEMDAFSDSPEPRSMSLRVRFPPGVNVPVMVSEGHDLGSATAKVMLWLEGTTEAMIVLDGVVRDPSYATADDPVDFVAEELPFDDRALWPPVRAVVDSDTWPNAAAKAVDEMYPTVFGAPPLEHSDSFGSPGLVVNLAGTPPSTFDLLIAGHHVEGGTIAVRNTDDGTGDPTLTAVNTTDGDGMPCAIVDLVGSAVTLTDDGDKPYWVRWGTSTLTGGMVKPDGTLMRGAGDLLVWWLSRSTLRWDRGRVTTLVPRLNAFIIDAALTVKAESRVSPWSWVSEHLLPYLPISARVGPYGLYFAWYEYNAKAPDGVALINADNGTCERTSRVEYTSRDNVANEIRVSSRIDAESDTYRLTSIVTGSVETLATEGGAVVRHTLCERSEALYGRRIVEISADSISDENTAGLVATWKASALAMQHRLVSYNVPRDFAHLEPGNVVQITDAGVNFSNTVALVESIPWGPSETFEIVLRVLSQGQEWST